MHSLSVSMLVGNFVRPDTHWQELVNKNSILQICQVVQTDSVYNDRYILTNVYSASKSLVATYKISGLFTLKDTRKIVPGVTAI